MIINNLPFSDFPIEFKEINPIDFKLYEPRFSKNGFIVENDNTKITIEPDRESGYINEVFQGQINLEHKNTVVVNAAVGQGKSHAIIQTIKRYYDNMQNGGQQYLIMVASPFVSLVKQYCIDIERVGVPMEKIFDYGRLGRENNLQFLNKPIHVITVNTLLGNPGEDGFKNSDVKRAYLNSLVKHCESNNIKVVFVYDEIHDSYHNFKMEYIFNLWKWRNVIHKNFILSATFNEASKIVMEYLAELTDRKIKIIESKRVRFPKKQSSLHLHYSPAYNFSSNTPEIIELIKELISRGKQIDILSYSKSLSKSLISKKEDSGKLLVDAYGEVNDCTSELVSNQRSKNEEPKNKFDNNKCNVGTNFKTGVSIKKDDHALIIIMPPRSTKLWFRNKYGIFSGGINSVIQALARQRVQGEIHIVLPRPEHFNYESLEHSGMDKEQLAYFTNIYEQVKFHKEPDKKGKYFKLNIQDLLLRTFYEPHLLGNLEQEIEFVGNIDREGLAKLEFKSYEQFKLEDGEDFLANEYPYFGEDISTYITYASITNQFVNCQLKEIRNKTTLFFRKGQIQSNLHKYFGQYFGEDYYNSTIAYMNFSMFYHEVRNTLFKEFELRYKKDEGSKFQSIQPYSIKTKEFEIQLLQFIASIYYGYRFEYKSTSFNLGIEGHYSRASYFLDSIKTTNLYVNESKEAVYEPEQKKLQFYLILNQFRLKLIQNIQTYSTSRVSFNYLFRKMPQDFFNEEDISRFQELESLMEYDDLLCNNVFEFKRRLTNKSLKGKLNSFYSMLCEDFVVSDEDRIPSGSRRYIHKVKAINLLPFSFNVPNLISTQDYNEDFENIIQAEIKIAGGEENYAKQQKEIIQSFKKIWDEQ